MGYLRPTALVVTGLYDRRQDEEGNEVPRRHWAEVAREQAVEIFSRADFDVPGLSGLSPVDCVSELSPSLWNDARSFCIFWDGSKEGWPPSDAVDGALDEFVAWLRAQTFGDGSSPLHWAWVRYDGDDGGGEVLATATTWIHGVASGRSWQSDAWLAARKEAD